MTDPKVNISLLSVIMKKNLGIGKQITSVQPSLHDAGYAKGTLKNEKVLVLPDIPGEKRIAYTIHEYPPPFTTTNHTPNNTKGNRI